MPYEKEEDEVNSELIQDDKVGLKRKTEKGKEKTENSEASEPSNGEAV